MKVSSFKVFIYILLMNAIKLAHFAPTVPYKMCYDIKKPIKA